MTTNTSKKKKHIIILAHIGTMVTMIAWGTSFLSTKVLMEGGGLTPVETYIYRFFLAYLILLCFTFKKIRSESWRDELILALCGICSGSLYFITENYALKLTTTANVSLLASISPLFTTFLMALVFRQRIKPGVLMGSIIAFAGVFCIIFSHGETMEIRPAGDLLALTAAFCWAIYSIAVKPVLPKYSTFFISRKMFFYGVLTALPLLLLQHEPTHLNILFDFLHPQYLFNMLFLVLFCSIMAYIVLNLSMKILGPVTANNYLYMQPLVTMVAGSMILGESIYLLGYVGCALIIGGLVISDKLPDGLRRL